MICPVPNLVTLPAVSLPAYFPVNPRITWALNNIGFDTTAGARTSIQPFNSNNSVAITAGDLLLVWIATKGTCTAVSDNTNGAYLKAATATNAGVELSAWYFRNSATIGINALIVTATTTSATGVGVCYDWGGGDGTLARVGINTGTGFLRSASAVNDHPSNLMHFMQANGLNDTSGGVGYGDGISGGTSYSNGVDCVLQGNRYIPPFSGDPNVGLRTSGINFTNSVAWCGIILFFCGAAPPALAGNPMVVNFPNANQNYAEALIANQGPYAVEITVGLSKKWLPAWMADIFPIDANAKNQLTVRPAFAPFQFSGQGAEVLITLAPAGDHIPGTFPVPLIGGAIPLGPLVPPAPWQAPNKPPIRISLVLVAGAANRVQLVAGVAGQTIYLFGASLGLDVTVGADGIALCDGDPNTTGTRIAEFNGAALNPPPHFYGGAPLTIGNGLYIMADVGSTVRGYASYSQA